ncbi:hypothetical protein E2C01_050070 [Portunus trituberculatus]|uniref:Uncharacterized protein n=1 Tax=Portunus trituberculatus TaxID=210409 RepID=A0A5B7GGA1_PORTR|nr:hypothetical protein [Portunus trituberculatus]
MLKDSRHARHCRPPHSSLYERHLLLIYHSSHTPQNQSNIHLPDHYVRIEDRQEKQDIHSLNTTSPSPVYDERLGVGSQTCCWSLTSHKIFSASDHHIFHNFPHDVTMHTKSLAAGQDQRVRA